MRFTSVTLRSGLTDIESTPLAATMELSKTHGPQQGAALMKRTPKYVGLDVHQATTLAAVREETGRMIARTLLPTDAHALVECFRGMRGPIHVAFEEGTQSQWSHDLLEPIVDQVIVCDRRGQTTPGSKSDRGDAELLADLLRRGGLRAVYHGSPQRASLNPLGLAQSLGLASQGARRTAPSPSRPPSARSPVRPRWRSASSAASRRTARSPTGTQRLTVPS
jgi:hypothetical protein